MSSSYYLFAEGLSEGKWECINTYGKKEDAYILQETYHNGSRTYFSSTYNKMEALGRRATVDELSDEMQKWIGDSSDMGLCIVDVADMQKTMPRSQKYEHHGFVEKSVIFTHESEDFEEIYEWLSPDEYSELPEESRKCYSYYEWNDPMGWYRYFLDILERVRWHQYDLQNTHSFSYKLEKVRIVAFHFY